MDELQAIRQELEQLRWSFEALAQTVTLNRLRCAAAQDIGSTALTRLNQRVSVIEQNSSQGAATDFGLVYGVHITYRK